MKKIKLEDGKEVSISDKSYEQLLKVIVEPKIDFSEFVGIFEECIAIKGKQGYLKSNSYFNRYGLSYDSIDNDFYDKTPDYEEVDVKDLKRGDIFYFGTKDDIRLDYFGIFFGHDANSNIYVFSYLDNVNEIEIINYYIIDEQKVLRFKR